MEYSLLFPPSFLLSVPISTRSHGEKHTKPHRSACYAVYEWAFCTNWWHGTKSTILDGKRIYNLRHVNYQFKIRYARTNVLKFSYFFRIVKSWNSLPLHLRKTKSLDDFKDCLKSFLHMKDISTFS